MAGSALDSSLCECFPAAGAPAAGGSDEGDGRSVVSLTVARVCAPPGLDVPAVDVGAHWSVVHCFDMAGAGVVNGKVRVQISFEQIKWTNYIYAADGSGSRSTIESPYLWTIFFKLDGESAHANSRGRLLGIPITSATRGSHGNLGVARIESASPLLIPASIGQWSDILVPIPVISECRKSSSVEETAIAGVAAVLMQVRGFSDHRAEIAHRMLNYAVRSAIVELFSWGRLHEVAAKLPERISGAIGVAEKFWRKSWSEPENFDQVIDHAIFWWSIPWSEAVQGDGLPALTEKHNIFTHRHAPGWWEEWELKGAVAVQKLPA